MKIQFRLDESNNTHTWVTLFLNGKNCGQLCMGTEDVPHLFMIVRHGKSDTMDEYVESGALYDTSQKKTP